MRLIVAATVLAAALGLGSVPAGAAAPHCAVSAVTPSIDYVVEGGDVVISGVGGLVACAKGSPANIYGLHVELQSRVAGAWAPIVMGDTSRACSSTYRFACGASVRLGTTLHCTDSDDPAFLELRIVATGGAPTTTKASSSALFTCATYGGGE